MLSRIGSPSNLQIWPVAGRTQCQSKVKLGDVIKVPHPWRKNMRVNKDSWWDRLDKRIVLRVQIGICRPGKQGPALMFLQLLPTPLIIFLQSASESHRKGPGRHKKNCSPNCISVRKWTRTECISRKLLDENRSKTVITKSNQVLGNHANIRKKTKGLSSSKTHDFQKEEQSRL
jgi:hypothetical protein